MIKDYQNKNVLAEMKRQVNAAAKESDREARITFVLVHMLSEHHELAESAGKPDGEDNLLRFVSYFLSRIADELEMQADEEAMNLIEIVRRQEDKTPQELLRVFRDRCPAKDAVKKGLEEWQEWPSNVPYNPWAEDTLLTAYATLFGLYYFNTPTKDLMRWLGKDDPKNPQFVNAMDRHETVANICVRRHDEDADEPKQKRKTMYVTDEQMAQGKEDVEALKQGFRKLAEELAQGDVKRFCDEKEDTAFGVFMTGTFAMMMLGDNVNRKGMVSSRDNAAMVYIGAKRHLMGKALTNQIVGPADDKAAKEVFYWGLMYGEMGTADGSMPTDLANTDVRRKPGPKAKK